MVESLCYSFWLNRRNTYIWPVSWSFKQIKQVVMIVRTSICHVTRKTSGNLNFSIDRLLRKSPCRKKRKLQRLANGNFLQQMVRETIYENEGMIILLYYCKKNLLNQALNSSWHSWSSCSIFSLWKSFNSICGHSTLLATCSRQCRN